MKNFFFFFFAQDIQDKQSEKDGVLLLQQLETSNKSCRKQNKTDERRCGHSKKSSHN